MNLDPNVHREVYGWHSDRLGIDMPIVRYGNWGRPLLMFPTAASDVLDNERFWLLKAIQHHILEGRVTVFAVDTINRMSWMDESVDPRESGRRQAVYASYIENEVVPHIRHVIGNRDARLAVTGASFGAFHAANSMFRRPDQFDTLIAMSGFYDLVPGYTRGHMTDDIYFNNPMSYVKNMHDERSLHLLRHASINLICGQGAYERPDKSAAFSSLLWHKGIPNNLDLWGHDVDHDWPWWRKMLDLYITRLT
jgi:esterase/lipase superfamily enzyme